jgi:endoglucanase
MSTRSRLRQILIVGTLLAALCATASLPALASNGPSLDPNTPFYVAKPNHGALQQIADLTASGAKGDANLISEMIETPQAVWFTRGTPQSVQQDVKNTVQRAAGKRTVPVLVAYILPSGADCVFDN